MPLFNLPDSTPIWGITPLAELHLRLGCVNSLGVELNKRWSQYSRAENPFWKFCDTNGIKKIAYRGNALEGQGALKMLSMLDLLEDLVILSQCLELLTPCTLVAFEWN